MSAFLPTLAIFVVSVSGFNPTRTLRAVFTLPNRGLGLQTIHQIIDCFEGHAAMFGGGSAKYSRLAGSERAETKNYCQSDEVDRRQALVEGLQAIL